MTTLGGDGRDGGTLSGGKPPNPLLLAALDDISYSLIRPPWQWPPGGQRSVTFVR